ncbi:MAG: NAD(+)/NADH kinase [Clostridiales bacterium]|nr:NAD(+)/NADH kinase [Clostridiales bacterium]
MLHIGMILHSRRADALEYAARIVRYLTNRGVSVSAEDEFANDLDVTPFSQAEKVDAIISLGGDGTLLRGFQYAYHWEAPLLGINLGRVGFLTEAEPGDIGIALDAVINGCYEVEERPVLHVEAGGQRWHALNDVVLSRGGRARLTMISAFVDGDLAGRYVADGVVVATPTGSTGYSLSAGGPIISPKVDCMVITPICAHTLQHRPTVVHGGAHITLELLADDVQTASLQVDGQSCGELQCGMRADIRMDVRPIRLIRLKEQHFFQLVRDKLTEWTR